MIAPRAYLSRQQHKGQIVDNNALGRRVAAAEVLVLVRRHHHLGGKRGGAGRLRLLLRLRLRVESPNGRKDGPARGLADQASPLATGCFFYRLLSGAVSLHWASPSRMLNRNRARNNNTSGQRKRERERKERKKERKKESGLRPFRLFFYFCPFLLHAQHTQFISFSQRSLKKTTAIERGEEREKGG